MKDEDHVCETARQKELDSYSSIAAYLRRTPSDYPCPEAQEDASAQHGADSSEQCPPGAGGSSIQESNGRGVGQEGRNRIPAWSDEERQQRRANVLPRPWAGGTQASWENVRPGEGIRVEVDRAVETYSAWRQPSFGSALKASDRVQRILRKDPNPGIPFVDAYPPSAGVTYWLVCAVVIGTLGTLAYLGVWK